MSYPRSPSATARSPLLITVAAVSLAAAGCSSAPQPGGASLPGGSSTAGAGAGDGGAAGSPPGSSGGPTAPPGSTDAGATSPPPPPEASAPPPPVVPSPPSSGTIGFHLLLGVAGSTPGDSLKLDGDAFTDLIMSNFVAGAMYGHLIDTYTPGMKFDRDYLYGSIFAQLLQENLATEDYVASSSLIDSSPDQQAVMGAGQGGPYQINNYAADMVYGTYSPKGYSLINFVALQKNIGYAFAAASTQYTQPTPAPFNDKFYGPMLTAYFHFNDYVALHEVGPLGGYTPGWEPYYDEALKTFESLPDNFLEVLLNVAYNQGYYGPLMTRYSQLGATATAQTVATVDSYASVWGVDDTYQQYPYQVRYYLDQLYDNPIPTTSPTATTTPSNHARFGMSQLESVFASVFTKLAYVDSKSGYTEIPQAAATGAFEAALSQAGLTAGDALDLSQATDRARIFTVLDTAIAGLETSLGTSFVSRTTTAL
jgi:hypothetical protein